MKKLNDFLPLINTLVLIIGGIFGYFLIYEIDARESEANTTLAMTSTKLNNSLLELNEIEKRFIELKTSIELSTKTSQNELNRAQIQLTSTENAFQNFKLEIAKTNQIFSKLNQRSNVIVDISSLLRDLQPNFRWRDCIAKRYKNQVEVNCSQENIGQHKVTVSDPIISIRDNISGMELHSNDYLLSELSSNTIMPGNTGSIRFYISGNERLFEGSLTISLSSVVDTDNDILSITKELFNDDISNDLLSDISTMSYNMNIFIDEPLR